MGVSDRDWQKENYNNTHNHKPDLSKTRYNSKDELELDNTPKKQKRPTIDYLEKIYIQKPTRERISFDVDELPFFLFLLFFFICGVGLNVFIYYFFG